MRFPIVINSAKTIAPNKQTGTAKNIQILFHKKINTIFHNSSTESQFLVFLHHNTFSSLSFNSFYPLQSLPRLNTKCQKKKYKSNLRGISIPDYCKFPSPLSRIFVIIKIELWKLPRNMISYGDESENSICFSFKKLHSKSNTLYHPFILL